MRKFPIITLIVALGALLLFQTKVVIPVVTDIAASGFFLSDTETKSDSEAIDSPMSNFAFMHCNNFIKEELDADIAISFPSEPINVWDLAGYQYVVNAEVEISGNDIAPIAKKYVCRIEYDNGSDQEGVMSSENWSLIGLSGLEDV